MKALIWDKKGSVEFNSKKAVTFFLKYCSEYAQHKELPEEVLFWSSDIQKYILAAWMKGDGNLTKELIGTTTSLNLANQLFIIAARCGYHTNFYVQFDRKSASICDLKFNKELNEFERDSNNELPSFRIKIYRKHCQELLDINQMGNLPKVKFDIDKLKGINNTFVYSIQSISKIPFQGKVYNFEVEDDNSYIANKIAVHNCHHIKFLKRNSFISDNDGKKRSVAELCGHFLYPESNKFIEGSWVETPAFKGAVLRNQIAIDDIDKKSFIEKYETIMNIQSSDLKSLAMKVVSACSFLDSVKKIIAKTEDPTDELAPTDDPSPITDEPTDAPEDAPDAPTDTPDPAGVPSEGEPVPDELKGLGETPDAPIEEQVKDDKLEEMGKIPYDALKKEIKETLMKQIKKELADEVGISPEEINTLNDVNLNDSLVKSNLDKISGKDLTKIKLAKDLVKKNGKKSLLKEGFSQEDILKIAYLSKEYSINKDVYKAMSALKIKDFPTYRRYAKAVETRIGRELKFEERLEVNNIIRNWLV